MCTAIAIKNILNNPRARPPVDRMTGVGGRPEVIIEGSHSASGPWTEYHFLYKPGDVSAAPRIVGKYP